MRSTRRVVGVRVLTSARSRDVGRRGLGLSERPSVAEVVVPIRNGHHVSLALPASNPTKHVWSFSYGGVHKRLKKGRLPRMPSSGGNGGPPALMSPKRRDWPRRGLCR
ncbi:hypothetical protein MPNT_60102 [Candidatus Methylacidithermus pantelleriae]|uniref:Uncharacterized protein n=1 Tax=Candidatus Methylacidithermus pantelleriae TaxID=2744239 RepID=A0A8J2FTB8_9BACT|nr:hypothetical protein MPNT_60102 [Candidatus Methylacidithermus pantelleriae]